MLRTRVIPTLLLQDESLVKTKKFKNPAYIGDPCNSVRIFNEFEVDELIFLDISATREKRTPNLNVLRDIASECFMPLAYGGGIKNRDQAREIFKLGFEKVVVNSASLERPQLISELASEFGSQAIIVSIDVKKSVLGHYSVYSHRNRKSLNLCPVKWSKTAEELGAGEIFLTRVENEGTWEGFDLKLASRVSGNIDIPVIIQGGAGNVSHIEEVLQHSSVSAVALGSMVVFQKQGMGVLITFPEKEELERFK